MKLDFAAPFSFLQKAILAAVFAGAGTFALFATTIRYSGSDFLRGDIETALNAAIEKTSDAEAKSSLRGSISGETALRNGDADFALILASKNIENFPEIKNKTWRAVPLAYQVAYITVSAANPATQITYEQLAAIFGRYSQKNASTWAEVGLPDFSSAMRPGIGDTEKTAAVAFFQNKALPNFALKPSVQNFSSDKAVFDEIVNNPGVIAVVSSPVPVGVPAKTLAVADSSRGKDATPYLPTFDNIYYSDYPLTIPLYVVYPVKNRHLLKPTLAYLYSDEMAKKFTEAGFVALEPNLRDVFQKGIDNIK